MSRDFSEAFGRADYPLDGVHLVSASAGTGKTYNIGNLYARLLMARGLRVSQLLVVTFTEAATAELRDRLRKLLGGLQGVLHGGQADPESQAARLVALVPEDAESRRRARDAVDRALPEFDQAAISTIHSFCGRALRRYAFESGLAFDAEPPGDVREAQMQEAARDWWRRNVALAPESEWGRFAAAHAGDFSLKALTQLAGNTLSRPDIRPDPDLGKGAADGTAEARARLLEVAFGLLERWNAERPERKAPDFDDILLGMREALEGDRREAFAAALRAEYAAVLVDEFQDTDPVQYEVFRRAFLEGEGAVPVYFIGDPKQAIYAFRGGDIYAFRGAAEAVPEERRWSLGENHRSSPGLVGVVNALFADEGGGYTFGDRTMAYPGDIRAAGGKEDIADGRPAVEFALVVPDGARGGVTEGALANAAAAEIAALLRAGPELREDGEKPRRIAPGDIAVLLRSGTDTKGKAIAARLRELGIRAVVRDNKTSVFRTAEAEAFRLLLAAFAEPGYAPAVRAAMLTPFFGLDAAAAVAALAEPDGALEAGGGRCPAYPFLARRGDPGAPAAMTDFLRVFREWADAWHARGFLAAFARMEADLGFRPRIAAAPGGERALVNLQHLAELLHARVAAGGASPAAALDWYVRKAAGEAGDEACLRLESDAGAVQILTIHSSKGLEFPVTVLPDAWKGISRDSPWHVFHRDEGGGVHSLRAGVSAAAADAERKEGEDEETRLLYVAFTRAAWRCIAVAPEGDIKDGIPAFKRVIARARDMGLCRAVAETAPWDGAGGAEPGWREPPAMPVLPEPRGRGSYSSLSPAADEAEGTAATAASDARDLDAGSEGSPLSPGDDEEAAAAGAGEGADEPASTHPIFAFQGGTALGECWHSIFEEADFTADDAELRPLVEKKLLAGGLLRGNADARAARTDAVLAMVRATLELPMDGPDGDRFRLADIAWEDRASEWEFDFPSGAAAATTARLREVLRDHWGGEPEGSDHRVFLRTLERWDRPIPKGFLMGYVDLLFRRGGRYYVVDWKSNALKRRESAFSPAGLRDEMAAHAYFLQYLVYSAVLHRHLRDTLPGYSWGRHFGGVRYVFLRGAAIGRDAVYADRPDEPLLDDFATALGLGPKGIRP